MPDGSERHTPEGEIANLGCKRATDGGTARSEAGNRQLRQKIEDKRIEGWSVDSEESDRVILVKRGYGSLTAHILVFVFTFYTLGMVNLLYAGYKYFVDVEKEVLRKSEFADADGSVEDATTETSDPTPTDDPSSETHASGETGVTSGSAASARSESLVKRAFTWWLTPVTDVRTYGPGQVVSLVFAAVGGAAFAWIGTSTGYTAFFLVLLPFLAAAIGMVVGMQKPLDRRCGLNAAGAGALGLFLGYALIQQWLPPGLEYNFAAVDGIAALVGAAMAFGIGSGGELEADGATEE